VLSVESPAAPRRLWWLDVASGQWHAIGAVPLPPQTSAITPRLIRFESHDGLPVSGWLYPAQRHADRPSPAMIWLHGGPEAQERPTFSPQHQVLAAAGITVLAPNIRGSSGFGRSYVHADDRWGRFDAIGDVAECARVLVSAHGADPARIAVSGRSYGGYATLLALVRHTSLFAAGVDMCGMSDLHTFFRDTEPWIAAAAVTKYGDPVHDAALLAEISPLRQAAAIQVPLLVVHGELDTNVPRTEALQLVDRLRGLDRHVEYLELAGEGHEYRSAAARLTLLETVTRFLTEALDVPTPPAAGQ
jgi:dipeptidyl aminopeptidase/acylaminoacyl peptidase